MKRYPTPVARLIAIIKAISLAVCSRLNWVWAISGFTP